MRGITSRTKTSRRTSNAGKAEGGAGGWPKCCDKSRRGMPRGFYRSIARPRQAISVRIWVRC